MRTPLIIAALCLGALPLSACAPAAGSVNTSVEPLVFLVSPSAARGERVTIQGRYLGSNTTSTLSLGGDEAGAGGAPVPAGAVVSWTDRQIVFTVPDSAPLGAGFLVVSNGTRRSPGLPFSVHN